MARLAIDEKKAIDESIFKYEERMNSPVARLQDGTPTYVTWYHINDDETTTDAGYIDVASIIGHRSPIKFQKIENLPIYGVESVLLQLQEEDQGLDTSFQSEAVLAPGTIKPSPNDFFLVPYIKVPCVFRVIEIMLDNIRPDNFFKFQFQLEYIDEEKIEGLDKQTKDKFTCILENIGSENRCIIEEQYEETINKIDEMYDDIASTYMKIFYNERYNCMLGEMGAGIKLYDPFQNVFMNKHDLFNKKNDFKTYIFTDQYDDPRARIKYEKSVYRCLERRNINLLNTFDYTTMSGMNATESSFFRYKDRGVLILDTPSMMPENKYQIFTQDFVDCVKMNGIAESTYGDLIQRFIRNETITINEIPLDLMDELLYLNSDLEMFFIIPMILYIIKEVVKDFMTVKTSNVQGQLELDD